MRELQNSKNNQNSLNLGVNFKQPSLSYAQEVEPKLKACKRFDLTDRVIFARNLGSIVQDVLRKDKSMSIHKIFVLAFKGSAESLYKKRKSLITLPNEEPIAKNLRSKARDYLLILSIFSKYMKDRNNDSEEASRWRLILRFIEGSSYDERSNILERLQEESRQHYLMVLNKLVERVTNEVDLDYMYEWMENYFYGENYNENQLSNYDRYVPSVQIAEITKECAIPDYTTFSISKEKINSSGCEITADFLWQYLGDNFSDTDRESFEYFDREMDFEKELFPKLIWTENNTLDRHEGVDTCYLTISSVNLEVRFDKDLGRWVGLLIWKNTDNEPRPVKKHYSSSGCKDIYLGSDMNFSRYYFFRCVGESKSGEIEFLVYALDDDSDDVFLLDEFCGMYPADICQELGMFNDYIEFALNSYEDSEYRIDINELICDGSKNGFVPAPKNTFSRIILENLVYSPNEKRIDNLLLEDAKEKHSQFQNRLKNGRDKFSKAINKL